MEPPFARTFTAGCIIGPPAFTVPETVRFGPLASGTYSYDVYTDFANTGPVLYSQQTIVIAPGIPTMNEVCLSVLAISLAGIACIVRLVKLRALLIFGVFLTGLHAEAAVTIIPALPTSQDPITAFIDVAAERAAPSDFRPLRFKRPLDSGLSLRVHTLMTCTWTMNTLVPCSTLDRRSSSRLQYQA